MLIAVAAAVGFDARVSANAPAGRYTVSAGTVFDTKTKLTWAQHAAPGTMSFSNGESFCRNLGASLGGTGWRLPSKKELLTLVDYSQTVAPCIDPVAFPSEPTGYYWTGTGPPSRSGEGSIIGVNFSTGATSFLSGDPMYGDSASVRCVH
jgi:hypothetical protein